MLHAAGDVANNFKIPLNFRFAFKRWTVQRTLHLLVERFSSQPVLKVNFLGFHRLCGFSEMLYYIFPREWKT